MVDKSLEWPTSGCDSSMKFYSAFIWSFLGTYTKVEVPIEDVTFFSDFYKKHLPKIIKFKLGVCTAHDKNIFGEFEKLNIVSPSFVFSKYPILCAYLYFGSFGKINCGGRYALLASFYCWNYNELYHSQQVSVYSN